MSQNKEAFQNNWNFQEQYINDVCDIIKSNAMHIIDVSVSTPEDDMQRATDLKITISAGDVAVRIRRSQYNFRDITIRAYKNGYKTEIHKLREGCGDFYLYAWENKQQCGFDEYVLFDINKARSVFMEDREIKMNKDGNSGFVAYSIFDIFAQGAIIEHKKLSL